MGLFGKKEKKTEYQKMMEQKMVEVQLDQQLKNINKMTENTLDKIVKAKTEGNNALVGLYANQLKQLTFNKKIIETSKFKLESNKMSDDLMKTLGSIPQIDNEKKNEEAYNMYSKLAAQMRNDNIMTSLQDDALNDAIGIDNGEVEDMINKYAKSKNITFANENVEDETTTNSDISIESLKNI